MLHRDNAAAGRNMVEPDDTIIEPDDRPQQKQHTLRPEPAKAHRRLARGQQERQPDRPDDRGPGEIRDIEGGGFRPAHRRASVPIGPELTLGVRSISGSNSAPRYFSYSPISNAAVPRHVHQCCCRTRSGKTGCGKITDFRHSPFEFEETARHVVPRGDEAQAAIALASHPLGGLERIAHRILGLVTEHDAAHQPVGRIFARRPQQVGQVDPLIDARYKKGPPFPLAQQIDAALKAQATAGQYDDRIGRRRLILGGRRNGEAHETGQNQRSGGKPRDCRPAKHTGKPVPWWPACAGGKITIGRASQEVQLRPNRSPERRRPLQHWRRRKLGTAQRCRPDERRPERSPREVPAAAFVSRSRRSGRDRMVRSARRRSASSGPA